MTKKTNQIKPCPKCGGKGYIDICYTLQGRMVPYTWAVFCENCNYMSATKGTKKAAIKSWNRGE